MKQPLLGVHLSIAKSLDTAFDEAVEAGCTTFQIFTRNPRSWSFKPLAPDTVAAFREKRRKTNFRKIVAHMPYLPNLASPDKATMKLSRDSLAAEVKRCDELGIDYLIAHLGSHLGKGTMVGVRDVAGACKAALGGSEGRTTILLENMAGQENCVGARFEDLQKILELVDSDRVGVCLDTCHLFAAGFDVSSEEGVASTFSLFSDIVGMRRLKVVHLNDSKGPLGGNLDRHEYVGEGEIGPGGFRALLHADALAERPLIMEVPFDDAAGMRKSLAAVRKLLD